VELKVEMMGKNPDVRFEVDTMENMANWQSVIIGRTCEELETETEQINGMKIIEDKLTPFKLSRS